MREPLHRGHNHVGPEDLLLALVREGGGVAARILLDYGIDAERVREELENPSAEPSGGVVAVPARIAAAGALALATAKAREENRAVDMGDLMLALGEGWPEELVAHALEEVGVDAARLREAVATARRRGLG